MKQEQNAEDNSNRVNGSQPDRQMRPVTIVSLAIIAFLLIVGFWWVFLGDHIPDQAKRAEVWVQSLLSTAILIVVAVQACIYFRQAKALDRQVRHAARQTRLSNKLAETAFKQFEITDRPWIKFKASVVRGGLSFREDGSLHMSFRFIARNVGRSVAVNTTIRARLVIPDFNTTSALKDKQVLKRQVDVCTGMDEPQIPPEFRERYLPPCIVFPGEDYQTPLQISVRADEVKRGELGDTGLYELYLVGCVHYQIAGHATRHHTRFAYEVFPLGKVGPLEIGEKVPPENLKLIEMMRGGDYTD